MTAILKKSFSAVKAADFDTLMITLLTVSIFSPFYLSTAVVAAAALLTMLNYERRQRAFSSPGSKFLLVFAVLVPFFVAAVYNNFMGMLCTLLVSALLVCGMYLRSAMTRPLFNRMMDLACALSAACAVVAAAQKLMMWPVSQSYRPVSMFENANYYGMMVEFMVLVCLYRLITNPRRRGLYLAVVAMNLGGLYLAASMSSFVAMACGVAVMLALKRKSKITTLFILGVAAFVALSFVFPLLFPRVEAIDHTMGQRMNIWQTSLYGIRQNPLFGQGALTYQLVYPAYGGYATTHSHNLLLDILLNYGFVGLLAFGGYAVVQGRLMLLRFRNRVFNNMNILTVGAVAAVLVHGLADVTILWVQTGMFFMLIFSTMGIGSAYLERKLRADAILLPDYATNLQDVPAYLKSNML